MAAAKTSSVTTGRLGRLASLARAGLGTVASVATGSADGIEQVVEKLGELRGIGTKGGQMAGLVEANLAPELRARVGPALAKLRAEAARSPYESIAAIIREDLGAPPEELFAEFEREPFASASLGQVHRAEDFVGRTLAVKVQHQGIDRAFRADLENVGSFGRVATAFVMPRGQGKPFVEGVKAGFLAELDYRREAQNLETFAALVAHDPELETPTLVPDRSSPRVLTTTFLRGEPVEAARAWDDATRRRQAAAIRRLVLSSLTDHGLLYADAHAGNFLFREDGMLGVLDFGSVFRFEEERRGAFAAVRDAAAKRDRPAFEAAIRDLYDLENDVVANAIAHVQWLGFGALVRGEPVDATHLQTITTAVGEMKKRILGQQFTLPSFIPFVVRTLIATNALLVALNAPESGPLGKL